MERDVEGEFQAEMDRAAQYEVEAEFERNLARQPPEPFVKEKSERTSKRPANKNEMGPGGRRKTRHTKKKYTRRPRKTKRRRRLL